MTNTPLLELRDVVVLRYTEPTGFFGLWGAKPTRALDGVSLTLSRGETLGIMGGSGSGKTTLAETATLRRGHDRGQILSQGQNIAKLSRSDKEKLKRRFQIVGQDARDSLDLDRPVKKQLVDQMRRFGLPDMEARVTKALMQVELEPASFLERLPSMMSGGQQQRLAIAKALMMNPLLVALDEPVSGVDPQLQRQMLNLLASAQKQQNLGYLLISQEPRVISRLAHRTAVMHAGRLLEAGPTELVLGEAKHPYSRLFLGHEAGHMPPEEDLVGKQVVGCPWAAHCPAATARCREQAPALREVAPGHVAACHEL